MILLQADNDADRETLILIVLEPENLYRMDQADPITLESKRGFLKPVTYPEGLRMVIAFESDAGRLYEMVQQGRTADLLRDVMRGYQYKAQDGKAAGPGKDWKSA